MTRPSDAALAILVVFVYICYLLIETHILQWQ